MYHSKIELNEGAYLVSDAHYSSTRPELLHFLKAIQNKELLPSQLILMGDIFDALFGGIKKTLEKNQEAIEIINDISKKIEVIYQSCNPIFYQHASEDEQQAVKQKYKPGTTEHKRSHRYM